jgi:erythronate-4-phosphate dehydrogenase
VVDNDALRAAIAEGPVTAAALDVCEGEPTPDPDLIRAVDVATPHIAGYAYDGKVRAEDEKGNYENKVYEGTYS